MSVYKKLSAARAEFHGMSLHKSGENKYAGFKYFELCDFLPTAQKLFDKHGLCGVVSFAADVATMRIVDVEKPEQFVEIASPMGSVALKGCHEVQNIGALHTYLRRYLWMSALEVVENDTVDATTGGQSARSYHENKQQDAPSDSQKEMIKAVLLSAAKCGMSKLNAAFAKMQKDNGTKNALTYVWKESGDGLKQIAQQFDKQQKQEQPEGELV